MSEGKYWTCIIGPVPEEDIHPWGDGPPRSAVKDAIHRSTGHQPTCASGWRSKEEVEAMQKASSEVWQKRMKEQAKGSNE